MITAPSVDPIFVVRALVRLRRNDGHALGAGTDRRSWQRSTIEATTRRRNERSRVSTAPVSGLGGRSGSGARRSDGRNRRIDTATICGTDLHILKGDVPEVKPGTILGHEAVGTVVEVGSAVTTIEPGDRVLVSCITSCGRSSYCKGGQYGLCNGGGGWIFGHTIDGLQAEFARVPFADTSVYKVPKGLSDEDVIFLADIIRPRSRSAS